MTLFRTIGRMAQAVAYRFQLLYGAINLFGLGRQFPPVDLHLAICMKHGANLIQRKPGGTPQGNNRQLIQYPRAEEWIKPFSS